MKSFIIFAVLFVFVSAKKFDVTSGNKTCASVDVEGQLTLKAMNGSTQMGKDVVLTFENATLIKNSGDNCDTIKINMGLTSAQVWFKVDSVSGTQKVTPISAFAPKDVFPGATGADLIVFSADEFGNFATNESFKCLAELEHNFVNPNVTGITFVVMATTNNLQIQFGDVVNNVFSTEVVECDQDKTTVTPVTTPSTTVAPDNRLSLNVTNGNDTCILLDGYFTIGVTFDNKTEYVSVPNTAVATGNCSYNSSMQTMMISFEKTWMLAFYFSKDKADDITISEIKITYDTSTFNTDNLGEIKTVSIAKTDFLKASSEGYYLCNSNTTFVDKKDSDVVSLSSRDLKYRAFNTEKNPDFSGDVAECPADEETSSVVPIAVGAALAGLVVIVLIAYLIGRRRARKTGYESV